MFFSFFLQTQSGRGAQNAFKGLSQSAVQSDCGAVYGKLLNQMLKRSWPVENVDEDVSEGDLLRHVLTWPTWCGFLEFFGKCKRCITVFIMGFILILQCINQNLLVICLFPLMELFFPWSMIKSP